jgi:putative inorganic carbon (hco3(-)) transporter
MPSARREALVDWPIWVLFGVLELAVIGLCVAANPYVAVGAVVALVLLLLAFLVPFERLLPVYAVVLVLFPNVLQASVGGFALTAYRALAPLLIGVFVLHVLVGREHVRRSGIDVPLGLFIASVSLSFIVTVVSGTATAQRYGMVRIVTMFMEYVSIYFLFFWACRTRESRRRVLVALVATMTLVAAYAMVEFATGKNVVNNLQTGLAKEDVVRRVFTRADLNRARSTFEHPISLGTTLAMVLPMGFALAWTAKRRSRQLLGYAAVTVLTGGLIVTVARGPYVAAALGLACLFVFARSSRSRISLAVAVAVGAIVVLVWGGPLFAKISSTFVVDSSVQSRLIDYPRVEAIISAHPYLGLGLGGLNPHSYFYLDNYFLATIGEGGVLGLAAFLLLFGAILVQLLRGCLRRSVDDPERAIAAAIIGAAFIFTLQTATFDSLAFSKPSGVFFILVAMGMSQFAETRSTRDG